MSGNLTAGRRFFLAGLAVAGAAPAAAQGAGVRLYRVVTQRDAITIGFTEAELASLGAGEPVSLIARRLHEQGQITAWQYASGRGADGSLAMRPVGRVAILRAESLRIEPYAPALPVLPPAP